MIDSCILEKKRTLRNWEGGDGDSEDFKIRERWRKEGVIVPKSHRNKRVNEWAGSTLPLNLIDK